MENCKICNEEFNSLKGLTTHARFKHGLNSKEYYDTFIKEEGDGKCTVCNEITTFRGLGVGYLKTCSFKCSYLDKDYRKKRSESRKGKKQSKETIDKRIRNTNQQDKEITRKKSMLDKYGVDNPTKLDHVKNILSEKLTGKKQNRSDEWQKNIIESKRRNGTLKHTKETKTKIVNSINNYYSKNLDREKYISTLNNIKHFCGWYNGLYFRSSLELSFLFINDDKSFITCEKNEYKIVYEKDDKQKVYYPDYTDGEFIYEIKPSTLLNYKDNNLKIKKAIEIYGDKYKVITEKEVPYIKKSDIFDLIEKGVVVVNQKSLNILEKYKH